jgi:Tol biopolymer transport system component
MTRLVVADGSDLLVVEPGRNRPLVRIPPHESGRLANRQPAWSPDGRRLAWSAFDRRRADAPTIVSVIETDGSGRVDHELVFPAFYLHWRPDGRQLAALSDGPLGIELTVLDLASGEQRIVARGTPLFFDWSLDGTLCVNVGRGSEHRIELVEHDGDPMELPMRPGRFSAPAWSARAEFVALLQTDAASTLSLCGRDGSVRRELAMARGLARFAVSADGRRVAYADTTEIPLGHPTLAGRLPPQERPGVPLATPDQLVVHDLDSDRTFDVCDEAPITLSWSPDGTQLLYCTRVERGEPPLLQWFVWSEQGTLPLAMYRPSTAIAREYLPFADQYARSRSWWSPTGDAFCYAGSDLEGHTGVWVQPLDRRAERVSSGQVAFWSPR